MWGTVYMQNTTYAPVVPAIMGQCANNFGHDSTHNQRAYEDRSDSTTIVWGGLQVHGRGTPVLLVWMPPRHSHWWVHNMYRQGINLWPLHPT